MANATDRGEERDAPDGPRGWLARGFTLVEDIMYVGLGLLLAISALALLGSTAVMFWRGVWASPLPSSIVTVLDQVLLTLILVELLYTVQVSFREHALVPEPFLIVGLVATIRRMLVLTAELTTPEGLDDVVFVPAMIELGVLTGMILALIISLHFLRRRSPEAVATRA